jgi:HPt (histidine-containing phosphotransfer) domain-containing protein
MLLEQLTTGLQTENQSQLRRAAHTLKGNFMILRLGEMRALAERVERLAIAGDLHEAAAPTAELCQQATEVLQKLQAYLDQ